jgi:predicted XRE-type DNA-binding protein
MAISAARFIREHILEMSQTELAQKLNVSQPAVAKYDRGTFPKHHRQKIRTLAKRKGREIREEWFDQAPLPTGDRDGEEKGKAG